MTLTDIPIRIAPYDPTEHFDAVLVIEKQCFQADAFPRETFRYLYRVGKNTFLVAQQETHVIGYISAYVTHREGYVASIAVLPDYRKQGVGQILMEAVIATFKNDGLKALRLHVRISNASAIDLYKRLNFTTVRVVSRYYGDGEDGMEMVLPLN